MNRHKIYKVVVLSGCLVLGGCDSVRDTFGLNHYRPNEWDTAEPHPGLILPPDFTNRPKLPAPRSGETNPHVVSSIARAEKTVMGGDAPDILEADMTGVRGENEVVGKALENQEVTPGIRKIVDEESQVDTTVSGKIISRIKSWKKEAVDNLSLSKSNKPEPAEPRLKDIQTDQANESE